MNLPVFPRLRWVVRVPGSSRSLHWNTLSGTGEKKTLFSEWTSEKNTSRCLSHTQNILKETLHRRKTLKIQWMTNVRQHRYHSQIQNVWGQKQFINVLLQFLKTGSSWAIVEFKHHGSRSTAGNSWEHCRQKWQGGVVVCLIAFQIRSCYAFPRDELRRSLGWPPPHWLPLLGSEITGVVSVPGMDAFFKAGNLGDCHVQGRVIKRGEQT